MPEKMKNCKACGKEVASSAKVCPSCGAKLKMGLGKKVAIGVGVLIVIGAIGSHSGSSTPSATPASNSSPTTTAAPAKQSDEGKMTMDKFSKIQNGMTYEEVTSIVGGPGTLGVETGEKSSPYYTVNYTYQGVGDIGANASLTFQGGKLNMKAQYGLK